MSLKTEYQRLAHIQVFFRLGQRPLSRLHDVYEQASKNKGGENIFDENVFLLRSYGKKIGYVSEHSKKKKNGKKSDFSPEISFLQFFI